MLFFITTLILVIQAKANSQFLNYTEPDTLYFQFQTETDSIQLQEIQVVNHVKFKRGKAILFTIFTGLLGGHRIYLGTHHRTPIIYSVTLGGLGILPLVDLINIIFTKDINKFDNKTQIIMWAD